MAFDPYCLKGTLILGPDGKTTLPAVSRDTPWFVFSFTDEKIINAGYSTYEEAQADAMLRATNNSPRNYGVGCMVAVVGCMRPEVIPWEASPRE